MDVLDLFRLDGAVAVVTGGGKGIGRGVALALAQAGAKVVVASRTRSDLEETAALIRDGGGQAEAVVTDVTSAADLEALGEAAIARFGALTVWVNNAGGVPDATMRYLTRTPEENWDGQIDLNLKAVWMGAAAAARVMSDGGAIINMSSRTAFGGHLKNGPYAAAKAAVNSLTATLALELAARRIRVNAIGPGPVLTQNFVECGKLDEAGAEALLEQLHIPLGRYGTPQDIGAAAVYLASPAAAWVTGQCLYVTGGY